MMATPMLALVVPPLQGAAILLPILISQDAISMWAYHRAWSAWNLKVLMPGACSAWRRQAVRERCVRTPRSNSPSASSALSFVLYTWLGAGSGRYLGAGLDKPRRPHAAMGVLWGALSGFMSTLIQVGAPPFQIHMLPQRLDKLTLVGTT